MPNDISIVDPIRSEVPTTRTVESCPDDYKLAEPASVFYYSGGNGFTYNSIVQEPPADVTYDHKRWNYVHTPEPSHNSCIREISSKKGHE